MAIELIGAQQGQITFRDGKVVYTIETLTDGRMKISKDRFIVEVVNAAEVLFDANAKAPKSSGESAVFSFDDARDAVAAVSFELVPRELDFESSEIAVAIHVMNVPGVGFELNSFLFSERVPHKVRSLICKEVIKKLQENID